MKEKVIEAEIVEEIKAPLLADIKYPVAMVDIDDLINEYKDVPDIDPESEGAGEQYQFVLKGHKRFVKARTAIEKKRKELKSPAWEYGKKVDSIAKEFTKKLEPTEYKLQAARTKVEEHEKRKQEEAERIELERVKNHEQRVDSIKGLPATMIGKGSAEIQQAIYDCKTPVEDVFEEYLNAALEAYTSSMAQLALMRDQAEKAEKADEIERERKAEAERKEAERMAAAEAEKAKIEEERVSIEREREEMRRQMQAEREEIERQRAEIEADKLAKKQEEERVEAEQKRKAEEKRKKAEAIAEKKRLAAEEEERRDLMIKESVDDLSGFVADDDAAVKLIAAIRSGKVRNISWGSCNE